MQPQGKRLKEDKNRKELQNKAKLENFKKSNKMAVSTYFQ